MKKSFWKKAAAVMTAAMLAAAVLPTSAMAARLPSQAATTQEGSINIFNATLTAEEEAKIMGAKTSLIAMGYTISANEHMVIIANYMLNRMDGKNSIPAYVTFDLPDLTGADAEYSYVAVYISPATNIPTIVPMTKVADGRYQIYMTEFGTKVSILKVFNPYPTSKQPTTAKNPADAFTASSGKVVVAGLSSQEQATAQQKIFNDIGTLSQSASQLFYYDLTLIDSVTGQVYTKENFPAGGVTVTMPFPAGKTWLSNSYRLFHFPDGVNGEMVEVKPLLITESGIQFHVNSLSPFVLVTEPVGQGTGSGNAVNVIIPGSTKSPKTGDANSITVLKVFAQSL